MRPTRLGWIAVTIILVLVGGLVAWRFRTTGGIVIPPPPPIPPCTGLLGRPLRVGIVTWPGYAGGIVANNGFAPNADSIYYKEHNLCVEFMLMEDVDARAKAFARGGQDGVDIVWSTVDSWANELPGFLKNDVKARVIMQVDWSRGGDAIVADNSIRHIEDLYRRRVSLALFTPSHWLFEYSLKNSKLDEAQQNEIVKTLVGKNASPDARADFVAGRVDAAVVWEPDVATALQRRPNSHVLMSTKEARKLIADVMVARENFIAEHPDVIQAFVEGWVIDGTVKANRESDTVARLLVENEPLYRDLGLDLTRQNLGTVKWANLADNTEMFNLDDKDQQPLFDGIFNDAGRSWVARGYIPAPVVSAVAKDDSFLRKIYQEKPVQRITDTLPKPSPNDPPTPSLEKPITVGFVVGGAVLDATAKQAIDDQVNILPKVFSGNYIRVEGNTDNVGNVSANRDLSERRAQAVVDFLVSQHGVPREQLRAIGNGASKSVASNDTAEGRARNRRTDIIVVRRAN
jgi:NitT/TauT family transport system substrate-binding protein